jgi:RNA polymerase sigma-70 factor (ECF subfamily)
MCCGSHREPPPAEADDSNLIEQTLAGKLEAFGLLIQKHRPHLYRLCLRMLDNHEDAEDVLQQVFIEAYRHLGGFRHKSQFSTWLHAIALNRARNHLRARKARRTVPLEFKTKEGEEVMAHQWSETLPTPDEIVEKRSDLEHVMQNLRALPSEYQEILLMHCVQNLTLREIAARLNRPLNTVKVYLHRARKELAERLNTGPGTESAPNPE